MEHFRVLFVPPLDFPIEIGGFQSQVRHIFENLKDEGINVAWYDLINTKLEDYDIIHFHSSSPNFINIVKKAKDLGKKVVVTPMMGSPFHSNFFYRIALFLSRFPMICTPLRQIRFILSLSDFTLPLTSFEFTRLNKVFGCSSEKMKIVPNGIDEVFLAKHSLKCDLPFKNYLLVVGRIEPDKNQLTLIRVVNKLGLNLVIVGEAAAGQKDYEDRCRKEAGSNVFFWGKEFNKQVMVSLYQNADFTIIPSLTEMLPLVIFESLSQNTPVICTTKCGLKDTNIPGVFFSAPKETDLLNMISTHLEKPNIQFDDSMIYSWQRIAQFYIEVYKQILS